MSLWREKLVKCQSLLLRIRSYYQAGKPRLAQTMLERYRALKAEMIVLKQGAEAAAGLKSADDLVVAEMKRRVDTHNVEVKAQQARDDETKAKILAAARNMRLGGATMGTLGRIRFQ